jgi:hypothetical protein
MNIGIKLLHFESLTKKWPNFKFSSLEHWQEKLNIQWWRVVKLFMCKSFTILLTLPIFFASGAFMILRWPSRPAGLLFLSSDWATVNFQNNLGPKISIRQNICDFLWNWFKNYEWVMDQMDTPAINAAPPPFNNLQGL